ncbi:MAG: hypothetical protein JXB26_14445 [Candidatus Aminicenantes bacterium]|nr:hypothetical protein [Candidatus Aminicenantes bacterium]
MKRIFYLSFLLIFFLGYLNAATSKFLIKTGPLFAHDEILIMSESYFELSPFISKGKLNFAFRLQEDSFDGFFWGDNTRWAFKAMPQFKTKSATFAFGPGLSLSSSFSLKNQISVDTYLYLRWKSLFLEIDSMFFKDGSFHKNSIGFEFRIKKWALLFCFSGLLNLGNEDIFYFPSLMAGTSYEF